MLFFKKKNLYEDEEKEMLCMCDAMKVIWRSSTKQTIYFLWWNQRFLYWKKFNVDDLIKAILLCPLKIVKRHLSNNLLQNFIEESWCWKKLSVSVWYNMFLHLFITFSIRFSFSQLLWPQNISILAYNSLHMTLKYEYEVFVVTR